MAAHLNCKIPLLAVELWSELNPKRDSLLRWSPAQKALMAREEMKRTRKKHDAGSGRRWRWRPSRETGRWPSCRARWGSPQPDLHLEEAAARPRGSARDRSAARLRSRLIERWPLTAKAPYKPARAQAGSSQFTSDDFAGALKRHGVTDQHGRRRPLHGRNFVERLWRGGLPPRPMRQGPRPKPALDPGRASTTSNAKHQRLGYRTPSRIYQKGLLRCGRSALPKRLRFPHFASKHGRRRNARLRLDTHRRHSQRMN